MHNSLTTIRSSFLDFFAKQGHTIVPSSSLVPHNDPTLMFSNAGMNQFKHVFTGAEKPGFVRAASSQKCVRAGGKHNDLDNVGYTARHHTFFEMLGNFSFGDYFKEQAIALAWNLLTLELGLPVGKLLVTVYHTDDEAFDLWKKIAGLPDHKIIRIPTNDNFWSMGDTGPCGPCSEIFYDHGENIPGGPPGSPGQDGDRFIEIWNLVFMQYEQVDKETRHPLPRPSIDTGMGLERLAAVLQGVHDNYDIDLFRHLIAASQEASGNHGSAHLVSHRVIADHLRSSSFLIADGVLPSNEGRGYVLRRIMRRAMRHAHQLGCREPLMHRLVPALITEMGEHYPELKRAEVLVTETLRQEEERFRQTLERGLKLLEEEQEKITLLNSKIQKRYTHHSMQQHLTDEKLSIFPGDIAFKLYDTYGFPLDLTQDILRGKGMRVDMAGFDASMAKQKADARAAWSGSGDKATGSLWFELKEKLGATEFLGYSQDHAAARLLAIMVDGRPVEKVAGGEATLIFNQTPFYGESGGQTGDKGWAKRGGLVVADILDTSKPLEHFPVHKAMILSPLATGDILDLQIDVENRSRLRASHSATHILHAVMRKQLGEHITQRGSLVAADKLRFDVSHSRAVTREEIAAIEQEVNRIIWQNTPVTTRLMTPDEAIREGAMALFGEKYGDEVRVVSMGLQVAGGRQGELKHHSTELCGGTHVNATGDIGVFKIVNESAVAAGIRRIEAVTRDAAFAFFSVQDRVIREISIQFKAGVTELPEKITALAQERRQLERELADVRKQLAMGSGSNEKPQAETIGSLTFISRIFDGLDPRELRGVADSYSQTADVVFAATVAEGKASLVIAVGKVFTSRISAVDLVRTAVGIVGGKGGGGRPEMAQGGGIYPGKLPDAVENIKSILQSL